MDGTTGYDDYIGALFAPEDDALTEARGRMQQEGLPGINVSAAEGKLLHLLAATIGARRILEVGTLGGYSAIWLARALPTDGKLITLELDSHHAQVAQQNLTRAGVADKVEIRVGPAAESLSAMGADTAFDLAFDLAFIDADKDAYSGYLEQVLPLVREGGLILGDNTLPDGVLSSGSAPSGTMRYNSSVAAHTELLSTIIPVMRHGGIDGLTVSIKKTRK